jgi:hypothetical protein
MFGLHVLDAFFGPLDDRSATQVEQEIHQEIDAHFELLVAEFLEQGLAPDEARQQAEARFGPRDYYHNACRRINLGGRLMFQRAATCAIVLLAGIVTFLLWEVRTMHEQHAVAISRLRFEMQRSQVGERTAPTPTVMPVMVDLTGQVLDPNSEPLPGAQLLVIVKTWPNGRYHQSAYHTESQPDGSFTLDDLLPVGEQYAVHIGAMRSGFTLRSEYHVKNSGDTEPLEPIAMILEAAEPHQLAIEDDAGNPVRGALVAPASRRTSLGEDHTIYFQASQPVQEVSDEAGHVDLDWCTKNDVAELYVQLPGRDWESYAVEIPKDAAGTLKLTVASARL